MCTRLLQLALGLLTAVSAALLSGGSALAAAQQVPDGPVVQEVVFEGLSSFAPEVVQEALGLRTGGRLRPMAREQRVAALFRDYGLFVQEIRPVEVEGGVRLEVRILEFEVDLEPRFVGAPRNHLMVSRTTCGTVGGATGGTVARSAAPPLT